MRQAIMFFVLALLSASPVYAAEAYDVSLDGAQVPVVSPYTGSGTVILNDAETQITVSITHNIPNVDVMNAHIHEGAIGVNGPVDLPFPGLGANPINEVIAVTPAQVAKLRAGNYYVNIHTFDYPNGEIRGQVLEGADSDSDLLPDAFEDDTGNFVSPSQTGSDPNDSDSDDDGVFDGIEVDLGTDPNDNGDVPTVPVNSTLLVYAAIGLMISSAGFFLYRRKSRAR